MSVFSDTPFNWADAVCPLPFLLQPTYAPPAVTEAELRARDWIAWCDGAEAREQALEAEYQERAAIRSSVRTWTADVEATFDLADAIWHQPWARTLEARFNDVYDASALTPAEMIAMRRWFNTNGFRVTLYKDGSVKASNEALEPLDIAELKVKPRVARFCVRCPTGAPAADCLYEHGDTLARLNEPCKFGDACKSPQRATCLRMHPGEAWTADMVIHRC
jgi:hypothetical protein